MMEFRLHFRLGFQGVVSTSSTVPLLLTPSMEFANSVEFHGALANIILLVGSTQFDLPPVTGTFMCKNLYANFRWYLSHNPIQRNLRKHSKDHIFVLFL